MNQVISHHILCAGEATVPFAGLAAACLHANARGAGVPEPRVFIHLDGVRDASSARAWLAAVGRATVTCGMFGIKAGAKIPGKWHQKMVNRLAQVFAAEDAIAIVDADFFLTDSTWWNISQQAVHPDVFSLCHNTRHSRSLTLDGRIFHPLNTILFTVRPSLHNALNLQMDTQSRAWIKQLLQEFPGAELGISENVDSMLQISFRAQAMGYRLLDLQESLQGCHIGGFSHFKASKFNSSQDWRLKDWIHRLRLLQRVYDWMGKWNPSTPIHQPHLELVREAREVVEANPELHSMLLSLPPSKDEAGFPEVERLLTPAS